MGSLAFISPAWIEREVESTDTDLVDFKTFAYGVISSGGVLQTEKMVEGTSTTYGSSRYVWRFKDDWTQWEQVEDKTIMIVYACGLLFLLISFLSISITECVPIKNRSTMFITMVIWDVLAALCIAASIIVFCATWHNNGNLVKFCGNAGNTPEFKAFGLGKCSLSWSLYGAVATACIVIFLTGLNIVASYQAKSQRRDAAFRHM